jgi:type IV secretory pathway VirB10-like protein
MSKVKSIKVTPNVTDPHMKSNKTETDTLLEELGEDMDNDLLKSNVKTKEEAASPGMSNILIIIFALIVIVLIVIIVWIFMRKDDKDDKKTIKLKEDISHEKKIKDIFEANNKNPLQRNMENSNIGMNRNMMNQMHKRVPSGMPINMHQGMPMQQQPFISTIVVESGIKSSTNKKDKMAIIEEESDEEDSDKDVKNKPAYTNKKNTASGELKEKINTSTDKKDVDDIIEMTNQMINKSSSNTTIPIASNSKKDNLTEDDKKLLDRLKEDEEPLGEIDE